MMYNTGTNKSLSLKNIGVDLTDQLYDIFGSEMTWSKSYIQVNFRKDDVMTR